MLLSILIPTLTERAAQFQVLKDELNRQINRRYDQVEIIAYEDQRQVTTGYKRNELLNKSIGMYVVFMDDDDWPEPSYIDTILAATITGCDAIAINGYMTTNGGKRTSWRISKDYEYIAVKEAGKTVYLRFNNHISPLRRSIAIKFPFPDKVYGEDYEWAKALHDSGLIVTEAKTVGEIYHYKFVTK